MRTKLSIFTAVLIWIGALASTDAQYSSRRQPDKNVLTFSKDVAPILFKHCASCHRPGEIAPMSLLTYEQARPWARAIAKEVIDRNMPPWHADAPAGTFHNERILTDVERETLVEWVNGGAPKGDPKDLPPAPGFTDGWSIGKPDVVFEMQEDYKLPATGTIEYEWLYIPTDFTEPKWVKSIEIRPGNREAVHHVLVYYLAKPDVTRASVVRPKDDTIPEQNATVRSCGRAGLLNPIRLDASSRRTHQGPIRRSLQMGLRSAWTRAAFSSFRCTTPRPVHRRQTARKSEFCFRLNRRLVKCALLTSSTAHLRFRQVQLI